MVKIAMSHWYLSVIAVARFSSAAHCVRFAEDIGGIYHKRQIFRGQRRGGYSEGEKNDQQQSKQCLFHRHQPPYIKNSSAASTAAMGSASLASQPQ